MILNLGCGRYPKENAINHDLQKYFDHVDITHDLDEYPWPWEDESAEEIYAIGVLEHLENFVWALEECHRILVPKGKIYIQVPYGGNPNCHLDPTHRWFLLPESIDFFVRGTHWEKEFGFYSTMRWIKEWSQIIGNDIYWTLEKAPAEL